MRKLFASFFFAAGIVAVALPSEAQNPLEKSASQEIPNFHKFGDGLYRGGRPQGHGLAALRKLGVKTIINLQGGDGVGSSLRVVAELYEPGETQEWIAYEKRRSEEFGMRFVHVPLNSISEVTEGEARAIGRLVAMMGSPANRPLYIHCEHGKDRTGLVVALYRVFYQGWTRKAAHDEMLNLGHYEAQLVTHDMDEFFYAATKGRP